MNIETFDAMLKIAKEKGVATIYCHGYKRSIPVFLTRYPKTEHSHILEECLKSANPDDTPELHLDTVEVRGEFIVVTLNHLEPSPVEIAQLGTPVPEGVIEGKYTAKCNDGKTVTRTIRFHRAITGVVHYAFDGYRLVEEHLHQAIIPLERIDEIIC